MINFKKLMPLIIRHARAYGNIKDSERVFQNLYKDESEWLDGALKRVYHHTGRLASH